MELWELLMNRLFSISCDSFSQEDFELIHRYIRKRLESKNVNLKIESWVCETWPNPAKASANNTRHARTNSEAPGITTTAKGVPSVRSLSNGRGYPVPAVG